MREKVLRKCCKNAAPLERPIIGPYLSDLPAGVPTGGKSLNSGHHSMGGDMSGQLFWQPSRGSPEYSPIPSPRKNSPVPSSRIHSGAVTPLHPRAGGPTTDDGKQQSHQLPLPPITISNSCPYSHSNSAATSPSVPRSPGRAENPTSPGTRWKKGKLLGRGTFGHVYLGFNSERGKMCAMKEVKLFSDDAKSKESAKQLGQEIALLSRLRHPNVVQYYGCEAVDDKLHIYSEYVSGGSIYKLLQEYGELGESTIRSYTKQILSGLAYLHAKNTVHRDIKGANILVDHNGRIKLAGFGMAKHASNLQRLSWQSCRLLFKGSPYWMAPEVIMNSNCCNLAVDIWSLGCTVLEMATTKPPWSQFEGVAAMFKIGHSKDLPSIPDNLPDEGKDFVMQCLQRNPLDRPTAAQLLEHPFVKNAAPLERPIIGPELSDLPAGVPTGGKSLAKALENLHGEEIRQRKEVVEMVKDLEQKMFSTVPLSHKFNNLERDELQIECNDALKVQKELRNEQAEAAANTSAPEFFSKFSYSEIVQGTSSFNQSLMIGQGGYGDICKGSIKMLRSNSTQGPSEFQQELLTGRPAAGIAKEVKYALDKGNLKNLLNPTAGDWPFLQAQQLAHIAMRCCEMSHWSRPDLAPDVRWALERMRVSCGAPPFPMNFEEDFQTPYFICPVSQAKASEKLHGEELRKTKEVEEMVKDLEQKMFSAVLSQKYNHMERDELQIECNNVLRKEQAEVVVYTPAPLFFSEFSYSEIVQATSSFNQSLLIGQGGCGDIYKGLLCHIQLAIKMLHSNSMQGPLEFQQEAVMEELIKMAKISYKSCSLAEKNTAQHFFKELNHDNDGKVSFHEFLGFIRDKGLAKMGSHHFFKTLDRDGTEILDFVQVMALYCMIQSGRPFCYGCDEFIPGMYFTCSSCHRSGKNVCCLCPECFENGRYCHEHDQFCDNYDMLEVKRMKGLDTHWKQQHQNGAKKKGNSLRDEIPFEVSSISMDEKLDSRRQFMHISQFDRSSPRPLALRDGGEIVGPIASSVREVATANNRAHLVGQDQCGSTVSHYEMRNNRETSDKHGLTMSLSCVEDHLQPFGCKHKDDVKSLCERQAFDATNNRANIIKADERGPTASNSDKGSTRKALKRARLSNVLSVEDLQQHFGARCKDAAKGLGDSIAWKSVKVGDSPLGAQCNSITFLVRRRTLTHKHCVRLKKSQDLQRSLQMDCSGGLSSQLAIGLPDGRHILSPSEKKIVRKTLKRKCRTMCVHILEDHRQHVDRRWENAAKASTTKHNSRQLVMHGVSTAKCICRQHGINQWPFQQHCATRKRYSLGDERSVEVTSLATDGKLVSRLQLIHISWLGRFSPQPSTVQAIALLSSEFVATINGANFIEQNQSSSTASHSGKKIIRRTANGKWINSSTSLENLQQLFGSKRKDAAESLGVSESTFKRICRQHGIERWPSQRGRRERQAFDATNNRANIIKVDERGPTASNSEKGSTRKALKRARLSNVLSVEDLQQHFGARCKDAAKGIGDSIAWKSVKVLDSPLGAQSNSIIFSVRRRTLTHKHCVRLKKSQDLQRSLRMDCSGGLSAQSAIGLPDGRHIISLSEKKIVRKTLKRKCRTICVHILEDHRHLDRRWENAAKASTMKHNSWQLVMHGVSTAKRIRRQHGINQWPFQQHFATRKQYSLGDERSVEVTSLATDGKLVSRLQLIHISWLGRFSPRRSTLPAIALLSSEFAATINGANFVEQDQSRSTASHSGKKILRRTTNGEWINSSISLENLQQLFGSKRKDAAESLGVSESKFKRICRQHGIERWPSQRGSQVRKPPDPAERNASPTCQPTSTGQTEPNSLPLDFFDGLTCYNTENGSILFPQPQVALAQTSSGNMGSSGGCTNLLVTQAEPRLEGHGPEASYWTMPTCSDLASSQHTPTIPYTMLSIPHTTPPLTIQQDMIKAIYGDTIIKFKLPLSSGIIGLKEEVSKRLKFELDSFEVKYKDEYGDLILIACDEDLRDCLKLFNSWGNQEIRLLVFDRFANTTNFCKNCRSLKRKRA